MEGGAGGADGSGVIVVGRGATPATLGRGSIRVTRVGGAGSPSASFLVWDASHCARLRGIGRLAVTAIGHCSKKVSTRGKAAAVPVYLSDEELWVAGVVHDWLTVVDGESGAPVDLKAHMDAVASAAPGRQLRRLVFAHLWRLGYRCTSGLKFGVDFLTYTNDPSQVHAEFMVMIRPDTVAGTAMSPLDLVCRSRVATSALKICVIAYGDVEAGTVRYAAFKRMGPGAAVFVSTSAYLLPAAAVAAAAEVNATEASSGAGGEGAIRPHPLALPAGYEDSGGVASLPPALPGGGAGVLESALADDGDGQGGLVYVDAATLAALVGEA